MSAHPTAPAYAVIIPHYNDVVRLEKCLAALAPQLTGAGEAVVADNNSTADLAPLKAAYPQIRFVTEPQKGAAAARNCGVAETRAPYLLFLDADCIPAADWIETAFATAQSADLAGGRVGTFDETPPPRSGAEAFETVFAFQQRRYVEEVGFSVTANLVTTRAIFEDVGPFRGGMSEDMDWCFRARDKGYRILYADQMAVSHPTRSDWAALTKKWRRITHEMFHLNGTSAGPRLKWLLRSGLILGACLPYTLRIWRSDKLHGAGEKSAATLTLWRLHMTRARWMLMQSLTGTKL